PYTWSIVGTLPSGLVLNGATGLITGTPTAVGTSTMTVLVTDGAAVTAARVLSISTIANPATPGDRTGLCNAYFRGSSTGGDHKRDATAFRRLSQAATAGGSSIGTYCGSNATLNYGRFHGRPVFSQAKQAQVIFDGGCELDLRDALVAEGVDGAWAQDNGGRYVLYVVNGGAVNGEFRMALPDGFADVVAVILVRR
ncbi:MAG: Ig domain-containing protein, partial [Chloroflexota bacterium]